MLVRYPRHSAQCDGGLDAVRKRDHSASMELSQDARTIIDALMDEGYAWLAGELLEQFTVGLALDVSVGDADDISPYVTRGPIFSKLPLTTKPAPMHYGADAIIDPPFIPIKPERQAEYAIGYLRTRLVEPFRRLADAERIAARIVGHQERERRPISRSPLDAAIARPRIRFALGTSDPLDGGREPDDLPAVEHLALALDVIQETVAQRRADT